MSKLSSPLLPSLPLPPAMSCCCAILQMGHTCAWYQEARKKVPGICGDPKINAGCPLACASMEECFVPAAGQSVKRRVFDRIMRLDIKLSHASHYSGAVLCVRENFDPVQACLKSDTQKDVKLLLEKFGLYNDFFWGQQYGDVDVTNCTEVEQAVSPFCSLPISDWNLNAHAEIMKSGGYTASFWIRYNDAPINPEGAAADKLSLTAISSLYPFRPLFKVAWWALNSVIWVDMFTTCGKHENVDVSVPELQADKWYFLSISYGVEQGGQRSIEVTFDTQSQSDLFDYSWCAPDWSETPHFIEAIQLNKGTMITPIEFSTNGAVPVKNIQKMYYDKAPKMKFRTGPSVSDEDRLLKAIEYDRQLYARPHTLVAPPILLQSRRLPSSMCNNDLGTSFLAKLW